MPKRKTWYSNISFFLSRFAHCVRGRETRAQRKVGRHTCQRIALTFGKTNTAPRSVDNDYGMPNSAIVVEQQ